MSDIKIRKLSSEEIKEIDRLVVIKKFPSREAYLRYLIQKDLNDELYITSHLKYAQLVDSVVQYLNASNELVKENNELISFLLSKINLK